MKKTSLSLSFSNNVLPLILSMSLAVFATPSVIADPLNKTALSRGTLSGIVSKNYPNSELSRAQIMIAILATNPHAFTGGNINFMQRNKKLTLPSEALISNIPIEHAETLLTQHGHFYQQGKTGNLTPPTFINTGADPVALENLKTHHSAQTVHIEKLSEESVQLQGLVKRLETEKDKRDEDLRVLEEKIQVLKESDSQQTVQTPSGEDTPATQRLKDKNAALQQQLIESKSELAENNRTTISLERRVLEMQEEKQNNEQDSFSTATSNNINLQAEKSAMVPTTEVLEAPATDLNGNITNPEQNQSSGFDFDKLAWALPLLALLVGLGFLFKRLFSGKKHTDLNLDELDDADDFDPITPRMKPEDRAETLETKIEPSEDESLEVSIKLEVAGAYMEADDNASAYEMLHEVLREGNKKQQKEANQLLAKL
jgi:FimV-like protein